MMFSAMITSKELARLLQAAPAARLSELSGVSTKQIYRLRGRSPRAVSPRLDTVAALLRAVEQIREEEAA